MCHAQTYGRIQYYRFVIQPTGNAGSGPHCLGRRELNLHWFHIAIFPVTAVNPLKIQQYSLRNLLCYEKNCLCETASTCSAEFLQRISVRKGAGGLTPVKTDKAEGFVKIQSTGNASSALSCLSKCVNIRPTGQKRQYPPYSVIVFRNSIIPKMRTFAICNRPHFSLLGLLFCYSPFNLLLNYIWGPALTSALPAALPSYFAKFFVNLAARSFAFFSHRDASA